MPTRHKCKNISNTSPAYDLAFIDNVSRADLFSKSAVILEKNGEKVAHSEGRETRWKTAAETIAIYAKNVYDSKAQGKLIKNVEALISIAVKWSHVDAWLHQGFIDPIAPFKDFRDMQAQMKNLEMIRKDLEKGQTTDKLNAVTMNSSFQVYKKHVDEGIQKHLKSCEVFLTMCNAWVNAERDFNKHAVTTLTGAGNIPNKDVILRLASYNEKSWKSERKKKEKSNKSLKKKREKSEKSFRKSREKSEKSLKKKMEQKSQRSQKSKRGKKKSGEKATPSDSSSKSGKTKKGNMTLGEIIQKSKMQPPTDGSTKSAKEKSKMATVQAPSDGSVKSAREKSKMVPAKETSVMKPPVTSQYVSVDK